ncbi:MAG: chloride channel protein [Chloroflexota bacterium]
MPLGGALARPGAWLPGARRHIRRASYERKWLVLGAAIGVAGGLGAIAFTLALRLATRLFLGVIAGLSPATPAGEGADPIVDALRPWALPLCVALGGLLSGIIVFRFAPEAEGHGTDAAIAAFHHAPRGVRARIPLVKLVASAITIGSGGSAGREGPTAQISAGFGSGLARLLDLDQQDARIAVAAGIAAGIGAIFRAPFGGAVLGAELMYRDDLEASALMPSFIATVVAFAIYGTVIDDAPIFGAVPGIALDPLQIGYYLLLGLVAGLIGRLYIRSLEGVTSRARRWAVPRWARPAVGGFMVGLIGLALPGVLGTGYGWAQASLGRDTLLGLPLAVVLALPFAKILATSLTIGTGGSGGIFGPGIVIGAFVGAGLWRLLEPVAPGLPADPAAFVIVAMMALFGSVAHAPLAVMLMVAEMTGDLVMLAPAMAAVGVAVLVVGPRTIYRSQLASKADSPAHRFRFAMPVLATLPVRQALRRPSCLVDATSDPAAALAALDGVAAPGAPVVDATGAFVGVLDRQRLAASDARATLDLVDRSAPTLAPDDALDDALGSIAGSGRSWAPVVADGRVVGVLSIQDAMAAYRAAVDGSVRQVRMLHDAGVLLEAQVLAGSSLDGVLVRDVAWPPDTTLVSIERGQRLVVPNGAERLGGGDRLTVLTAERTEAAARAVLGADASVAGEPSAALA